MTIPFLQWIHCLLECLKLYETSEFYFGVTLEKKHVLKVLEPDSLLRGTLGREFGKSMFPAQETHPKVSVASKNSFGEEVQAEEYDGHLFMSDHFGVKTTLLLD